MQKFDAGLLANQLNGLAEVFDKKALTPKALEIWFDTLKEFPLERVISTLISWPKSHQKFPVPSELWKILNEQAIDSREAIAASEKLAFARSIPVRTEAGSRIAKQMAAMLRRPARIGRRELAQRMLDAVGGDSGKLLLVQRDFVAANLGVAAFGVVERVPGEDDEELQVVT